MKISFLYFKSSRSTWFESFLLSYEKKLKGFCPFKLVEMKAPSVERGGQSHKLKKEAEKILKVVQDQQILILFDERGQEYSSESFSKEIFKIYENSGSKELVFLIGGAYGVDQSVKERANYKVQLSSFVMNHQVAAAVALEQIYRACTIERGIPYHNL